MLCPGGGAKGSDNQCLGLCVCTLHMAEMKYAQIEKDARAIMLESDEFDYYLVGSDSK